MNCRRSYDTRIIDGDTTACLQGWLWFWLRVEGQEISILVQTGWCGETDYR